MIRGGGGLRKLRWPRPGKGKRGGLRAIYYLVLGQRVYVLDAYAQADQKDLTQEQLRRARETIERL